MSINKVTLIGLVGKDPEVRETNGSKVASFTLATSERYKDKNGEYQTNTEWHNLVCWRQAEFVEKYITKGSQIYVEGKLRTRSWDDKQGQKRYVTEILVNEIQLLGKKENSQGEQQAPVQQQKPQQPQYHNNYGSTPIPPAGEPEDDDMPF